MSAGIVSSSASVCVLRGHRGSGGMVDIRASNEPSRILKFYNHREGSDKGFLLTESAY